MDEEKGFQEKEPDVVEALRGAECASEMNEEIKELPEVGGQIQDDANVARPNAGEVEPPNKKTKRDSLSGKLESEELIEDKINENESDSNNKITEDSNRVTKLADNVTANSAARQRASLVASPKHVSWERKKKVALLMAYCGAGYFGMQKNPGVNTIEDELIDALHEAGAIKSEVKDDLGKMSFQRCARTDKGVSAASQVVSLKMVPNEKLLPIINKHLPPSIRVFALKRVTKGFDSKLQCSARTYQYLTPTFAFAPSEILSVPSFRIKPAEINEINNILKLFCGTHNFHNFTSGKSPNEASSKRYIMGFSAGETFVKKGYEFITLSVKGQSFMLHQIRKMIGLCIAICRGYCSTEVIEKAWGMNKVDIPKAPGLGLILNTVHYDRYNEKFGSDGLHQALSWEENETEINDFKNNFIWDTIIESEITQKSMLKWLSTLNNHTYTENRNQNLHSEQSTNS